MVGGSGEGREGGEDGTHGEDLDDVVGRGADRVDVLLAQHLHQARPVRLQNPLLDALELALVRHDHPLLVVRVRQVHVHLRRHDYNRNQPSGMYLLFYYCLRESHAKQLLKK